jgi:quinol monooxygenase YgiN
VIAFLVRTRANAFERRELSQALVTWTGVVGREALSVYLYEDIEAPGVFCVVSEWENRRALDAHLCGDEFGVMFGAWELLARAPQVRVAKVAGDGAIDELAGIWRLRERFRRTALTEKDD